MGVVEVVVGKVARGKHRVLIALISGLVLGA